MRRRAAKTPARRASRGKLLAGWPRVWPSPRSRRGLRRAWRRLPKTLRAALALGVLVAAAFTVNWTYQAYRKPAELLFPVSGAFYKAPRDTWRAYGALFRLHSTAVMTPDLLAALAQVEGSGNPVVRTYWRWLLTSAPFEIYRPASSAVGMYQITNGTFAEARRYCVHRHAVATVGAWYDVHACWFNSLYTRTVPSHAIELTSAYLDRRVAAALEQTPDAQPTLEQKQALAALIHLCGSGAASGFVRRGFALAPGETCGDHDARTYLARVAALQRNFVALAKRT